MRYFLSLALILSSFEPALPAVAALSEGTPIEPVGSAKPVLPILAAPPSSAPSVTLIYDEPTSAQDGRTQAKIEEEIAKRRGKTTQIVIAHRLSNIQRADKIVVFADGRIIEQGTHDQLMQLDGTYASMWDAQRLMDKATEKAAATTEEKQQ